MWPTTSKTRENWKWHCGRMWLKMTETRMANPRAEIASEACDVSVGAKRHKIHDWSHITSCILILWVLPGTKACYGVSSILGGENLIQRKGGVDVKFINPGLAMGVCEGWASRGGGQGWPPSVSRPQEHHDRLPTPAPLPPLDSLPLARKLSRGYS